MLLLTGAVQVVAILLTQTSWQPLAKASHAFSHRLYNFECRSGIPAGALFDECLPGTKRPESGLTLLGSNPTDYL